MSNVFIAAAATVTEADLASATMGPRFGRLDLQSRLALLAVESLEVNFEPLPRDRIGICLEAKLGSLATDVEYWKGRDLTGGPSPTLFAYTLPSAAIGEIAIRHRITGPDLCFIGDGGMALPEAVELIRNGELDGCVCVSCNVAPFEVAKMTDQPSAATACAIFLTRGGGAHELREFDRDMQSLCALVCARKSAN